MKAGKTYIGVHSRWLIERRADWIHDPVTRLRYLQSAMGELSEDGTRRKKIRWSRLAPLLGLVVLMVPIPTISEPPSTPSLTRPRQATGTFWQTERSPRVWRVEEKDGYDVYSNGLRIENSYAVEGENRPYPVYDSSTLKLLEWQSGPVGIVYHATETQLAPFDANHNGRLQLIGQWLLEYVQRNSSYHFVIDRFGRVHRVVRETDSASHAGYSIWADGKRVYVNLNPSFIGIAIESQTEPGSTEAQVNQAQIHTATILTQMLRSKYEIRANNCVTHMQVSVNPWSMKIGNHTDWAVNFPFTALGLGNNYGLPLPSLSVFGFRYDADLLSAANAPLWRGIARGEDELRQQAASKGISVTSHRAALKKRYREILEAIEEATASKENKS